MTTTNAMEEDISIYGFPVYDNFGKFARVLTVRAGNALIAEIKAPRFIGENERLWYSAPILLHKGKS